MTSDRSELKYYCFYILSLSSIEGNYSSEVVISSKIKSQAN